MLSRISALSFYTANKYSVLRNVVVVGCVYEAEEKCSLTLFLSSAVDFALADTELTRAHRTLY